MSGIVSNQRRIKRAMVMATTFRCALFPILIKTNYPTLNRGN